MQLENSFEVPLAPDAAWALLRDIERIAPCMPGATITEVTGPESYKGEVAVRLGPVALSFAGRAEFTEIDDAAHTARVKAQGADTKGRGGAVADVAFKVVPEGAGSRVEIATDLNLSGSIAQYGRGPGIIQATAEQLVDDFAENLRGLLAASGETPEAERPQTEESENTSGAQAPPKTAPISGFSLMFRVILRAIRRLLSGGRT